MMKYNIKVEWKHIYAGHKNSLTNNPLALALKDHNAIKAAACLGKDLFIKRNPEKINFANFFVNKFYIYLKTDNSNQKPRKVPMSKEIENKLCQFDKTGIMFPFSFELII